MIMFAVYAQYKGILVVISLERVCKTLYPQYLLMWSKSVKGVLNLFSLENLQSSSLEVKSI